MSTARRLAFCRACDTETPQRFVGHELVPGHSDRRTELYRCECAAIILTYADVEDAEGLVLTFYAKRTKAAGAHDYGDVKSLEREDVLSHLRAALFDAYRRWDAGTCRFRAYAWTRLGYAWIELLRAEVGNDSRDAVPVPKALHVARSLDALTVEFDDGSENIRGTDERGTRIDPLERALGSSDGDLLEDRIPDLERELARRGRRIAREVARMGLGETA